jgi:histidinol-phosphate aminotransferase
VLAELPLERYPDPAARRLRAAIARRLGVAGDQLVFGNGSDELIAMLCAAFAAPPARVLYPAPSFVYYRLAAVARGVESIEVPLDARFELPEADVLRAVAERRPSVVFLALPNNPTGTLWRMDFALELAARHPDVVVVSDEAYVAFSGATHLPRLAAHPNLVVMRTLSKAGMAGLRVGYTISSPAIAAVLEKVRVLREIRRLAAEGYAVVFSSHDPSQAFLAASRVLLLARGGALRQGTPAEVITAENLRQVYGVEVRVAPLEGTSVCLPVL